MRKASTSRLQRIPAMAALLLGGILATVTHGAPERELDHREDYRMDSISGGDFRDYISAHITENDRWAQSMRTFGSFHNHMHELMSQMARHGTQERGDTARVPDFEQRISGGEWRNYRDALEAAGDDSVWYELVRITEIMHDRVHHTMARSLMRDRDARERQVNLDEFLRGEPLPYGEGVPADDERHIRQLSLDEFRELAWRYEAESQYLHQSVQSMNVFAHMLDDLLAQWLAYAVDIDAENCQSTPALQAQRGEGWSGYVSRITDCEDPDWREFVLVAGLMRDRIHHMLYKMSVYGDSL